MDIKELDLVVKQIAELYRNEVIRVGANATGKLANCKSGIQINDNTIDVILYLEYYYKFVENGRRPGRCPIGDIKQWVKVRNIVPRPNKQGVTVTREQLVYAIANKIRKYGYKGRHPLGNVLNSVQFQILNNKLLDIVGDEYDKEITSELNDLEESFK